jgi:hypothetical protein
MSCRDSPLYFRDNGSTQLAICCLQLIENSCMQIAQQLAQMTALTTLLYYYY